MTLEEYRTLETKCKECHVLEFFSTENMTLKFGELWDQECTTQGCKGDQVITGAWT